ncbi:chromate transport protein [Mycoplasmopsis californica HAZ160_1]|uniref:Chromate transport protein n=1 Tax=Mycoplasmopsis californica HAZ160_1 TaxID=1397850 RepID=A0AAT9F7D8_9BACT|nr:chromate transporter [Mycoplasmopsis californica]BAP00811.1 chromate transport protein [Mycoplasmopsis californica HAZ160_1]BBG40666.1 chromate transport protein [Mycoplasmopsis californica]BBG41261.1 chromate transport protein [Mycoplasmopsis californica]BBG41854.1 chromate transport protein [Mycoplasmopsis californica]BBG42447.1 chromate transport protein [Mycoplasmopsis californica]
MEQMKNDKYKKPTFWNIFILIIMITFVGFGGGNALMPVIKRYVVDKYGWIDSDEFDKSVVVTNMLPGPMAIQVLSYISIKSLGFWKGMLVVTLGAIPHVLLTIALFFLINLLPLKYLYVVQVGVLVAITGCLIGFGWNYFIKGRKQTGITLWMILFISTLAFSLFVPVPYNLPIGIMLLIIAIYSTYYIIKKRTKIRQNTDKTLNNEGGEK